jgi:hypothetical protein
MATDFCKLLQGTWFGQRDSNAMKGEKVTAVWETILDGSFLHERWFTSGGGKVPQLHAMAYFKVVENKPADFFVIYRGGKMAIGESALDSDDMLLFHRWVGPPGGKAEIRLRLVSANEYHQEVFEANADGLLIPISKSVLVRQFERIA